MNTFIGEYFIDNLSICDNLIEYFKNNPNKIEGLTAKAIPDKEVKDSTDLPIHSFDNPIITNYMGELQKCLDKYLAKYEYANHVNEFWVGNGFNIQHYKPNQGYHAWHFERLYPRTSNRHLTWMTYLNDVDDGGETAFYYQDIKVKAQKGKTVIFPVDWTHTHKGITSPTQDKYIITGWFIFK